ALLIGSSSRGTPRIAKKILRRIRDFAQVKKQKPTTSFVRKALQFLGINEDGLTNIDLLLLRKIIEHFNGGPVGLETLASLVGEDADTIETVYEPFLLRKGYLEKTARGRQIPHKKLPRLTQQFLGQQTLLKK
ncbi:MAG: Holliday junction DNA helicase RuvB C-terminal domain-containing protein, partial [Candidatus Babeliales bacterium]